MTNEEHVPGRHAGARHSDEHLPGCCHVLALGVRIDQPGVDEHGTRRHGLGGAHVDLVAPEGWEAGVGGEDGAYEVGAGPESPRHAPQ